MEENKEKPKKGFWRKLWDNAEPYDSHEFWERHRDEIDKENDDFSCGLLPSDQNFKEHKGLV